MATTILVVSATASSAATRVEVVVELFTAQGCAACPPAQTLVNALAQRPDVLALSFSVTYWDALGWRDRFARPEFTERQRRYAAVGRRQLATPQVILNGRIGVVGNDSHDLEQAIRTSGFADPGPTIAARGRTLAIGGDRRTARLATVWLVDYNPRTLMVAIDAGENRGRTLPHRNVVRRLRSLGSWRGQAVALPLPPADPRWQRAVIVQSADGGAIIAGARLS